MKATERHHPADDRLIALYFDDQGADVEEQRVVRQHLHGCETCTWRYTELVAPLEQLRADAASEADEIFTPARLEAQRRGIRERIEQGARANRVIPFPHANRVDRAVMARPVVRWIAAAAAAGLLIGVSAGRFIDVNRPAAGARAGQSLALVKPSAAQPNVQPRAVAYSQDDSMEEAFLTEVEAALSRHRIAALSALDDLTPHAREAVLARR